MGLFQRFRDASRRQKASQVRQEISNQLVTNPLCSDYENVFAQVQPITNDMLKVQPYGVGKNGGRLPMTRTPELAVLFSPNEDMGWVDFASSMFNTWLTEDELDIHVHFNGRKVIGYTILPPHSKVFNGAGDYYYQVNNDGMIEILQKDEVMSLRYSRSPENMDKGISPATAIRAWAQTEDVLAQYERAYIENGAIPASITFIRASSQAKFESVRRELESNLRGASNHGKTIYVWRQFNNDTGESMDQVEVKTIQGNNSTLAIKELTEIINDHLNKAYGVSNFILGDDSSAKYDNAELSDYQFIKRRIHPNLIKFWDQFQHELDRVVGGLGYGIQFELELPDLTERQKVRAEIAKTRAETLKGLIEAGSNPRDAVLAMGLSDEWLGVARGIYSRSLVVADTKQKDTQNTPTSDCKRKTHPKLHCTCGDGCTHSQTPLHSFTTSDELPPMTKEEQQVYSVLLDMAERIFANTPNISEDEVVQQIMDALSKNATDGAVDGATAIVDLLKNAEVVAEIKSTLSSMNLTGTLRERLEARTSDLVARYGAGTRKAFESVLNSSQGKSAFEIKQELEKMFDENLKWQAERIARTETVYAYKSGRLDEDIKIRDRYDLNMRLVWHARHDSKTCDVCAAMDGKTVTLGEVFEHDFKLPAGTKLINGKELEEEKDITWDINKWNYGGRIAQPHPNCRCYVDEEVIE